VKEKLERKKEVKKRNTVRDKKKQVEHGKRNQEEYGHGREKIT
jgi:hypothetical protein